MGKVKGKKINVVTLGCSKNVVDSEHVMAQLAAAGYDVVFDSNGTEARTVVVNTCGFIGDAKEESINTILGFVRAKEEGAIDRLFVIGCLSERYAEELRREIPEVDAYFGARDFSGVVRALTGSEGGAPATERMLTTPGHYAYLKISEGCNWRCAYCAIPLIRGPHVSVPEEQVLEEAGSGGAGYHLLRCGPLRRTPSGPFVASFGRHTRRGVGKTSLYLSDRFPRRCACRHAGGAEDMPLH